MDSKFTILASQQSSKVSLESFPEPNNDCKAEYRANKRTQISSCLYGKFFGGWYETSIEGGMKEIMVQTHAIQGWISIF